jgi:hypothetical protein
MPRRTLGKREIDARPDRIDLRDREYQPRLVSLPDQHPCNEFIDQHIGEYVDLGLILDQGNEGACTGFGLAAVVNYLLWDRERRVLPDDELVTDIPSVSPRMLYQMARIYDEWPGEDYEGSSCRGAMKGWHRHGVCRDSLWPYWKPSRQRAKKKQSTVPPKDGWQRDAATRPLGAYYRVNKDSIAEMQAAIFEVGAVYCSGMVHSGWDAPVATDGSRLAVIQPPTDDSSGGHAFAVMGYTVDGFIVQNSWGTDWGSKGFALLPYEDWIQNGMDAWVAVLGAPMRIHSTRRTRASKSLEATASGRAQWFWRSDKASRAERYQNPAVQPLEEGRAYEHTVVLGNDGQPLNSFLVFNQSRRALRESAYELPKKSFDQQAGKKKRLAIYVHGGLNSEKASIKRVSAMAPYLIANDIYPLFITWKSGWLESLTGILGDEVSRMTPGKEERAEGWINDKLKQITEAKDRALESVSSVGARPLWTQMKQNAAAAAEGNSGLMLIAKALADLKAAHPGLELHLIGHSAGSIVLGHLLELLTRRKLKAHTCSLYAPACTIPFANKYYGNAVKAGTLSKNRLFVDVLSDDLERGDSVGPYGHSLLYLVSRALETVHKMPLLGMQHAWLPPASVPDDSWHKDYLTAVKKWQTFAGNTIQPRVEERDSIVIHRRLVGAQWKPIEETKAAHGSFDNDVEAIERTLLRILSATSLNAQVECLLDF